MLRILHLEPTLNSEPAFGPTLGLLWLCWGLKVSQEHAPGVCQADTRLFQTLHAMSLFLAVLARCHFG